MPGDVNDSPVEHSLDIARDAGGFMNLTRTTRTLATVFVIMVVAMGVTATSASAAPYTTVYHGVDYAMADGACVHTSWTESSGGYITYIRACEEGEGCSAWKWVP
jgi:hypothetical protein